MKVVENLPIVECVFVPYGSFISEQIDIHICTSLVKVPCCDYPIPTVASSLTMALEALDADREFLTAGGVFTDDMIDGYIELKAQEVERLDMTTHPVEFDMYYSV